MKTLIFIIYIISISIGAVEQHPVVEVAQDTTYLLLVKDEGGNTVGSGSGFAISPTRIVTNYHVADEFALIYVYNYKGNLIGETYTTLYNEELDISILEFYNTDIVMKRYLRMYDGPALPLMTDLIGVGYPFGDELSIYKGVFQGKTKIFSDMYRNDMSTAPGMSGGPVLVFYKNQYFVLGITSAHIGDEEGKFPTFSLFVHISNIRGLGE